MKLIPEIREAWRYSSVRLGALATAFGGVWMLVPEERQIAMLQAVGVTPAQIPAVLGFAFLVTRLTSFRKGSP